jgi:hypothetical protein
VLLAAQRTHRRSRAARARARWGSRIPCPLCWCRVEVGWVCRGRCRDGMRCTGAVRRGKMRRGWECSLGGVVVVGKQEVSAARCGVAAQMAPCGSPLAARAILVAVSRAGARAVGRGTSLGSAWAMMRRCRCSIRLHSCPLSAAAASAAARVGAEVENRDRRRAAGTRARRPRNRLLPRSALARGSTRARERCLPSMAAASHGGA